MRFWQHLQVMKSHGYGLRERVELESNFVGHRYYISGFIRCISLLL